MATHSSTLAQKIPWTEELGRLQSMGSLRVDTTEQLHFHFSLSCIGEENGTPLQCSCLENPRDGGAWWAAVYGIAQSWTGLKRKQQQQSFLAALGLHYYVQAFSSCSEWGLLFLLHGMGCSLWWLLLLQSTGSRHMGLVVPRHMGSFQTRDQTHVLCIGRQILNHWTPTEVL